jgi:hypothetical protein
MAGQASGPRSVPEIREAIALFEKWERAINDYNSAKAFTEAIELLDDYLECEPDTPHKAFIQNLRVSNTRRLLQLLTQVDKKDFGLWLEYALAAATEVDEEAQALLTAQPELRKDFDAFMGVWGDVLQQALRRHKGGA